MKAIHLILAMACLILVSCYSVGSVKRYGVEATLMDADQATPIAKVPVMITIDDETFTKKSNRHGEVRVQPNKEHHITWLGGPAILSDWEAQIRIHCEGYEPFTTTWLRRSPEHHTGTHEHGGVIHLGELKLKRTH